MKQLDRIERNTKANYWGIVIYANMILMSVSENWFSFSMFFLLTMCGLYKLIKTYKK